MDPGKQLPDTARDTLRGSTFWQYARRAGFSPVYFDPFRRSMQFHSVMEFREKETIDEKISFSAPWSMIDMKVAERPAQELSAPGKQFLVVEKMGGHPPHNGQWTPSHYAYEPQGFDKISEGMSEASKEVFGIMAGASSGVSMSSFGSCCRRPFRRTSCASTRRITARRFIRVATIGSTAVSRTSIEGKRRSRCSSSREASAFETGFGRSRPQYRPRFAVRDIPDASGTVRLRSVLGKPTYGSSLLDEIPGRKRRFVGRVLFKGEWKSFDQ